MYLDLQESPAYRSPKYLKYLPEWNYLRDMYEGVSAWSRLEGGGLVPTEKALGYLPRHPEESSEEYNHRFAMTDFPGAFASSLGEYADLMFANGVQLKESPDWFREHWRSLSDTGQSGEALLPEVALLAMTYGVVHLFVDYSGGRPWWVPILPTQVVNWGEERIDGRLRLTHVSIETIRENGDRVLTRYERGGAWRRWRYEKEDGKYIFHQEDSGVLQAMGAPLTEIPLVPVHVSATRKGLMIGDRPFRPLADKAKVLYQVLSDYRRKMKLCNTPVPVLYDPTGSSEDVVISPNRIIRLQCPEAYFKWVETSTESLRVSREELRDLTEEIAIDSAKFLTNPKARISSMASDLSTIPLQATLFGFSKIFLDAVMQCVEFHQLYVGERLSLIDLEIVPTVSKQQKKDAQIAFSAQSLYKEGVLSRESVVRMLEESKFISQELMEDELNGSGTRIIPGGTRESEAE